MLAWLRQCPSPLHPSGKADMFLHMEIKRQCVRDFLHIASYEDFQTLSRTEYIFKMKSTSSQSILIWMRENFFVPPENKCWWWRGSGSTHSGLVEIQLERIHKAGTRTKLLAMLVWLCNQTTRSYARTPLETMWFPQWQTMYNLFTSLNLLLTLVSLTDMVKLI